VSRPEQSGGRVTATGEEGRHECAAPAGDCNREGGRGNTGAAAVHKAGEERRFGATPATATPLPSSWKARDPVRLSETRSLRVRARRKRPEGQGSHREACVCRRPGVQIHVCADERSVRRTRSHPWKSPRTGSRSNATSAGTGQNKGYFSRRIAPVAAKRSSGATRRQGESHLEWSPFRARPSEARSRLETGRHGKIKAGGPRQSPRSACLPTG
jgi:hypothetical protein